VLEKGISIIDPQDVNRRVKENKIVSVSRDAGTL